MHRSLRLALLILCAPLAAPAFDDWQCGLCATGTLMVRLAARARSESDEALRWESDHFALAYTTNAGPDQATLNYVTSAAAYLEQALAFITQTQQYRLPANIEYRERLPVSFAYLGDRIAGVAGVADSNRSYIIIGTAIATQTNHPLDMLLSTTCAHELFHTVQFRYQGGQALWWTEGTAVWMENRVFPAAQTYTRIENRVPAFFAQPNRPFQRRTYDACALPAYLAEQKDDGLIRAIWERCQKTTALRAVQRARLKQGWGWRKMWADFGAHCYTKQFRAFDAAPGVALAGVFTNAALAPTMADTTVSNALCHLGFNYYEIDPAALRLGGTLRVTVAAVAGKISAVLLAQNSSGAWKPWYRLGSRRARMVIRHFGSAYTRGALIVFSAETADTDAPVPYQYSYRIED